MFGTIILLSVLTLPPTGQETWKRFLLHSLCPKVMLLCVNVTVFSIRNRHSLIILIIRACVFSVLRSVWLYGLVSFRDSPPICCWKETTQDRVVLPGHKRKWLQKTHMLSNDLFYENVLHLTSCSLKLQGPETGLLADEEETIKTDKEEETVLVHVCHQMCHLL